MLSRNQVWKKLRRKLNGKNPDALIPFSQLAYEKIEYLEMRVKILEDSTTELSKRIREMEAQNESTKSKDNIESERTVDSDRNISSDNGTNDSNDSERDN